MYKKRFILLLLMLIIGAWQAWSQIRLPAAFKQEHPRLGVDTGGKNRILSQLKAGIDTYVDKPSWIVSRLQMYWKTKAREVFIKGGVYGITANSMAFELPATEYAEIIF